MLLLNLLGVNLPSLGDLPAADLGPGPIFTVLETVLYGVYLIAYFATAGYIALIP